MSYIVKIQGLYDNFLGRQFGSVGVDLNTGKIRYFTNLGSDQEFYENKLFEFNIDNPNTNLLRFFLMHCDYKRERFSSLLPKELESIVYKQIELHHSFNQKYNYTNAMLNYNKENLSIEYMDEKDYDKNEFYGLYVPVKNIIGLNVLKDNWEYIRQDEKEQYVNALLHEIGHMKVSGAYVDEKNSLLHIRCGFCDTAVSYDEITLDNGDVFLEINSKAMDKKWEREKILEEMMNDFECRKISPNYYPSIPFYGVYIDALCDRKLSQARYKEGITTYYDEMTRLINSSNMADELLDSVIEVVKSSESNYEKNQAYTLKLINKYAEAKNRKR